MRSPLIDQLTLMIGLLELSSLWCIRRWLQQKKRRERPSKATDEVGEDIAPLKRKSEKKRKDASTSVSLEVVIAAQPLSGYWARQPRKVRK